MALARLRPSKPSRANLWLLAACVGLTLFALGPQVTLGTRTIVEYDPAWWGPLATFRASGRFFWPVFYVVLLASLAGVLRRVPRPAATAVLAAAVSLQAADLAGVYRLRREGFRSGYESPLTDPFWSALPAGTRHLVICPSNMCVPCDRAMDYRPLALVAGTRASLNGGYAARYDAAAVQRYCAALDDDMRRGRVEADTVYVVAPEAAGVVLGWGPVMSCRTIDGVVVCSKPAA
ncbi:MAG: hypothetical protein R2712_14265 [Vicinamibacterales bacterium]